MGKDMSELTTGVEMSPSLPFLKRPELLDGSLPGDRGFDPFNFASDNSALSWYRDSEIKHARLAMLATVGWPIAELAHKGLATRFDLDQALAFHDKAPSVLNGGLSQTDPLFWVGAISAAAALEFVATKNGDRKEPGDFGFDPMSLGGRSEKQRFFHARGRDIQWAISDAGNNGICGARVRYQHVGHQSDTNIFQSLWRFGCTTSWSWCSNEYL